MQEEGIQQEIILAVFCRFLPWRNDIIYSILVWIAFNRSHKLVFFLPGDVFLPDAGADVEDEENGAATKEDEQGASRCLRINQSHNNCTNEIDLPFQGNVKNYGWRNPHQKTFSIWHSHCRSSLGLTFLKIGIGLTITICGWIGLV